MFSSVRKFAQKVTIASAIVVTSVVPVAIASPVHAQEVPVATAYSSISVKVNNVSFRDLYNFTTDLHNDSLWFPNVAETVQTHDANNSRSKKGIEYDQVSYFNGIQLNTHVVVKRDVSPYVFYIEGNGPVATYNALYTFNPSGNNSGTFTLSTKFTSPGLTEEALTYLLNQAMGNILTHFGTTGDIHMNFIYIQ